jgi:hypothetical protein
MEEKCNDFISRMLKLRKCKVCVRQLVQKEALIKSYFKTRNLSFVESEEYLKMFTDYANSKKDSSKIRPILFIFYFFFVVFLSFS